MEVYIEYVIIDNLVIDTLILLCVRSTLKLKAKWYRVGLSAVLGTAVAVVMPLLHISNLLAVPIKLALGLVMVLVLAKYNRVRDYIFAFLLFVGYTILLVGACLVTLLVFGTDLELLAAGGYDIALPLGIIFAIVVIYVFIIAMVAKYLSRRRTISPFLRKVVLCLSIYHLELDAFIDTGNKLVDKTSGMPVIILSFDALLKHFDKAELEKLMLNGGKGCEVFKGVHKTPYSTISGEAQNMTLFEADKLVIKGADGEYTTNKFIVGVTYKKFNDAMSYQMLLNPMVL